MSIIIDNKERRNHFKPSQLKILKKWLNNSPYPTIAEKKEIACEAEISLEQVNCWFINMRRRRRRKTRNLIAAGHKCIPSPRQHGKRNGKQNFSREQVKILSKWVNMNLDHPYPCSVKKEQLANKANMSYDQVQHWFINWRCRNWRVNHVNFYMANKTKNEISVIEQGDQFNEKKSAKFNGKKNSTTPNTVVDQPLQIISVTPLSPMVTIPIIPYTFRSRLSDFRNSAISMV